MIKTYLFFVKVRAVLKKLIEIRSKIIETAEKMLKKRNISQ